MSSDGPIVYEVNIVVRAAIATSAYIPWLTKHAKVMHTLIEGLTEHRIVHTPSVERAACPQNVVSRVFVGDHEAASESSDWHTFTVTYWIRTRAALDDYIAHRAAAMRADALKHFSTEDFVAWRRIMNVVA